MKIRTTEASDTNACHGQMHVVHERRGEGREKGQECGVLSAI